MQDCFVCGDVDDLNGEGRFRYVHLLYIKEDEGSSDDVNNCCRDKDDDKYFFHSILQATKTIIFIRYLLY